MVLQKTLAILSLVLGGIGIVACLTGVYFVWWIDSQLEQTNERVATLLDRGLSSVQSHLRGVQERVSDSRITAQELANHFEEQAKKHVKDRLISKLELEQRTEGLSKRLESADRWLEISSESIRSIQQLIELGQSLGASINPSSLTNLLERLESSRTMLEQVMQRVQEVRASMAIDESDESRRARIVPLIARILVTISDVDNKLKMGVEWITELQTRAHQSKVKMSREITNMTLAGYAILIWIALGQFALSRFGWRYGIAGRFGE